MRAKVYLLSAFFISCFAAQPACCQQVTATNANDQQEFLKAAYIVFSETKQADTTADAGTDATTSSDADNDVASTEADSTDSKEATQNNVTKSEDGSYAIPGVAPDKKIDQLISKYAEMISIEPEDVRNFQLYKFINDWYGVKYKWGGTDNSGIDCSAFSQKLYGNIYGTNIRRTARQQHRASEKIKDYGEANEGDLVFFRIHHIRISHVGVYLANGYFVHASRSRGVMISSLNDHYWSSRYAGCGRIQKQEGSRESDTVE